MLISDPLPLDAKPETKAESASESSEEECSESGSECGEGSVASAASDRSTAAKPNGLKEKLAACSLCVDVG